MNSVKKARLLSHLSSHWNLILQGAGRAGWKTVAILVVIFGLSAAHTAETPLISAGSTWKYLDNGSNQGTAWRAASFNDSGWSSGAAQLGYGDGGEATLLSFGPDANNKFITTYFRRAFSVVNPSVFTSLTLRVLRDDGAVVYLNGTEVWRTNMPAGPIGHTTPASVAIGGADENTFFQTNISPNFLVNGTNVLAVELHQANVTSTDISFDLQLIGTDAPATPVITRGPYLQTGTPSSIIVRWRTDQATDSRVRYGISPGTLTSNADTPTLTTEHEVTVSGLSADTTYYYSIGTTTATLAGGDANHFFVTSPATGTTRPTRIWVLGDSGTANSNAQVVRDAYLNFAGATITNLWLMLGDNAYNNGTDAEYQAAVFNMYPTMLRKSVLWPTIGNHDTAQSISPPANLPYYQIFTLPTNAEAGGMASGTEDYYSFDYGNIHFICLDSMTSDRSPSGAMMTWLQSDLGSTLQPWIVAFWHHPPYSKGSHDSDSEAQLIEMRQNALPFLEAGGVDLVLTGHSHSYERSFLIDGHYASSSTFNDSMKKNGGDGREGGNGAYTKPSAGLAPHEGAVYAVAGSSGQISGGLLNHPAMFISLNSLGSMVLDVDSNRLDAKFLNSAGVVADHFTLIKGSTPPSPPAAPTGLNATAVSSSQINLVWADNSTNEGAFRIERSTDNVTFTEVATVSANVTSYSATGLAAGTAYYFRVRASNPGGDSAYSNTASATTLQSPPAAPTSLTATAISTSQINLTWSDSSNNESGFRIERCQGVTCTNFTMVAQVGQNVTSFSNTGLLKNTVYRYRVRAFNATTDSAYSNIASARTLKR
jgi:calcineurin-like phosphoesterase family protein/purple acid phosphatase-like protein/fibronectin type III domain protein